MSKPSTILFLDHSARWSGGEISLFNLVTHLDRSKWNPVVVLFEGGPLRDRLSEAGIETRLLPLHRSISDTRKDAIGARSIMRLQELGLFWRFCISLRRLIWRERADIIHCNSLKADIIGGVAGRLARVPVIWHVRDRISDDYLPPIVVRAFRLLARVLPTHVIAVSRSVQATLNLPGSQARVIHNGTVVHDGVKLRQETGTVPRHDIVGLVGRISPWKGQHIFIEAAAKLRTKFPLVRFQIVGSALFGEDEYEAQVKARAMELGLNEILEWTGFRRDVPELVSQMAVVVHASTTGEPFGQVIVEGMVAGKPIVATDGGGVPEIVVDGETGILVPMGDASAMAQAIERLIADPATAKKMGEAGRLLVEQLFTIEASVSKVEAIYQNLL